ncbi:unnamed protein product, partial [Ceratitis capitata]
MEDTCNHQIVPYAPGMAWHGIHEAAAASELHVQQTMQHGMGIIPIYTRGQTK